MEIFVLKIGSELMAADEYVDSNLQQISQKE